MNIVRTVCGDIEPTTLGITYLHEHLIGQPQKPSFDPDFLLDNEDAAVAELGNFRHLGGSAIVEMSPVDYGRDPVALRRISERSGVHILATTGYIKSGFADPFVAHCSVPEIADEMIRDVDRGFAGTKIRAGLIKAGSSLNQITANEKKVFQAAALAHRATGACISTHTEAGTMGLEQVEFLTEHGVGADRILIGHMDRLLNWDYHVAVAKTGVTLGYDQFSKEKYYPDAERVAFIAQMVQAGYRDQISISGDMARRIYWESYGGTPGFAHILSNVVPALRRAGLTQDDLDAIFIRTPARLLQFQG